MIDLDNDNKIKSFQRIPNKKRKSNGENPKYPKYLKYGNITGIKKGGKKLDLGEGSGTLCSEEHNNINKDRCNIRGTEPDKILGKKRVCVGIAKVLILAIYICAPLLNILSLFMPWYKFSVVINNDPSAWSLIPIYGWAQNDFSQWEQYIRFNNGIGHLSPIFMIMGVINSIAPVIFLKRSFRINSPGCVSAGHPSEHGASWQSRQRSASAIAWARSSPLLISLNLSALLTIIPPSDDFLN